MFMIIKSVVQKERFVVVYCSFAMLLLILLIINAIASPAQETYVNKPFLEDFNGTTINTTNWRVATWKEHGGQTGKERCFVKDGFLNMQFINDSVNGFLSSAIETKSEYLFGRWEARLKPSKESGVLNSFFTIDWDNTSVSGATNDGTKQEIDIELLTFAFGPNTGKVHFAVHAEGKSSFETNPDVSVNFNPSEDFHVWGFEITPDKIEWFVDGVILKRYIYNENAFPITAPYQIKLNHWSAKKWINGPPKKNVVCTYLIDWIQFTPSVLSVKYEAGHSQFSYGENVRMHLEKKINLKGQIIPYQHGDVGNFVSFISSEDGFYPLLQIK